MTNYWKVFLIIFIFLSSLFAQNKTANVAFVLIDKKPSDKEIFITGNNELLGNWNPALVKLKKLSDSLWTINFNFPIGTKIEFKFTKGSWAEEALSGESKVPLNYVLTVKKDTMVYLLIQNWKNTDFKPKSTKTGNIIEHKNFIFIGLEPRDISVWLPPSYKIDVNKKYPVLYMHDGQNLFDESGGFSGSEWKVDETADSLIKAGLIKEIIVVGINNSKDRRPEYSNTELGKKYCRLLIDSIKTFIDKNYRTLSDKNNTATAGSSMGGLISFILGWEFPEVFSMVGSFSPAMKVKLNDTLSIDYLVEIQKNKGKKLLKIYIDNGSLFDEKLQPGVDECLKELKKRGYIEGKDLLYIKDNNSDHNEIAWAKRFPEFLKFMFAVK